MGVTLTKLTKLLGLPNNYELLIAIQGTLAKQTQDKKLQARIAKVKHERTNRKR